MPTLSELRLADAVDIAIVALLLWLAMAWLRTSRARSALLGLASLGALFLVARGIGLQLTTWLLQGFFAIAALVLVVVFQDDLRRLFESIAVWGLRRAAPHPPPDVVETLARVCQRFARARIGALIVLPGREPLERHLEGGVHLAGRVSEALLESLFDPTSSGHDGAVIVRANEVARFGVHLPLSTDWDALGEGGTRHAAALGLAERSDALCLVVSEERGEVSIACDGTLRALAGSDGLADELHRFIERATRVSAPRGFAGWAARVGSRWREGILALAVASGLWYVAVPGAAVDRVNYSVPVTVANLPEGYVLQRVEPAEVKVRLEGRRRDLYLIGGQDLTVQIDALLVQLGRRTFQLGIDQVRHPGGLRALAIDPPKVRLVVEHP